MAHPTSHGPDRTEKRAQKARLEQVLPLVLDFCELLERAEGRTPDYVQVGAHDGVEADPLYTRAHAGRWSGLLIEPAATYFARLEALYGGREDMKVVNVGISDTAGEMLLHTLDPGFADAYPPGLEGCASLDRDLLVRHLKKHHADAERHVRSETVSLLPLSKVLEAHGVHRATGLVIDVEGHEAAVFRSFSLDAFSPRFVFFEHKHLDGAARREIAEQMRAAGYSVHRIRQDTLCLRSDMHDHAGLMAAIAVLCAGPDPA